MGAEAGREEPGQIRAALLGPSKKQQHIHLCDYETLTVWLKFHFNKSISDTCFEIHFVVFLQYLNLTLIVGSPTLGFHEAVNVSGST